MTVGGSLCAGNWAREHRAKVAGKLITVLGPRLNILPKRPPNWLLIRTKSKIFIKQVVLLPSLVTAKARNTSGLACVDNLSVSLSLLSGQSSVSPT